jgi:hypothetical protein
LIAAIIFAIAALTDWLDGYPPLEYFWTPWQTNC